MARIPPATRDQIAEKERPAYDAFMLYDLEAPAHPTEKALTM